MASGSCQTTFWETELQACVHLMGAARLGAWSCSMKVKYGSMLIVWCVMEALQTWTAPCRQLAWHRRSTLCISSGLWRLPPPVAVPRRAPLLTRCHGASAMAKARAKAKRKGWTWRRPSASTIALRMDSCFALDTTSHLDAQRRIATSHMFANVASEIILTSIAGGARRCQGMTICNDPLPRMDPIQLEDGWQWEKSGENAWSLNTNVPAEVSSDEDEDGYPKAKLDAGPWGIDRPLTSTLMGKRKPFADGFGLCSPGRWPPAQRRSAASTPALGLMEALGAELEKLLRGHRDVRKLAMQLAAGKVVESPFSDAAIAEGRELIFVTLELAGTHLPVREHVPNQQELLRLSLDPDYKASFLHRNLLPKGCVSVSVQNCRGFLLYSSAKKSGADMQKRVWMPRLEKIIFRPHNKPSLCRSSFWLRLSWGQW